MKRLIGCALAGLSLAASAQSVVLTSTVDGGFSGSFVQSDNGAFFDTFTFMPESVAGEVKVTLTDLAGSVNFFTALLNGQGFAYLPESGNASFAFDAIVTAGQPLQLQVFGFAGDASTLTAANASYGGQLTISPVPEPEMFVLMLAALCATGIAVGRRRAS